MKKLLLLLALAITSARAQDLDDGMQAWWALPEKAALKVPCSTDLKYATEIANRRSHGASIVMLLHWAEQEAEQTASKYPSDQYLPIGLNSMMLKLIQRVDFDRPIYEKIPGGFSQWVYKSCLKGKSLD